MMSCSVNAGITARSGIREKLNSTSFSNYRYAIVETDNLVSYVLSPPSANRRFIMRHLYRYNRINNTFIFLGTQKAQSVYRNGGVATYNNSNVANLNNNKIYSNINPDFNMTQLPLVTTLYLSDLFRSRNLYHNQVIFVDVRWIGFTDGERKNVDQWFQNEIGTIDMNQEHGNIYRIGTISKEDSNTIDKMLQHVDLMTPKSDLNFNPSTEYTLYI
jgi:hypothetical protein